MLLSIRRAHKKYLQHSLFQQRIQIFEELFFSSTLTEWTSLDINIRNCESYETFKKSVLISIRQFENPIFNFHNLSVIPSEITRLRLGFIHQRNHKIRLNFQHTLNPICICGENIETPTRYLLHLPNCLNERMTLNKPQNVEENIFDRNYPRLSQILLFGDSSFNNTKTKKLLFNI